MFGFIQRFQRNLHKFSGNTPYLQRVLTYQKEIDGRVEAQGGSSPFSFADKLEFKNVDFSYKINTKLREKINLRVK